LPEVVLQFQKFSASIGGYPAVQGRGHHFPLSDFPIISGGNDVDFAVSMHIIQRIDINNDRIHKNPA
jgi:hypothetical protein